MSPRPAQNASGAPKRPHSQTLFRSGEEQLAKGRRGAPWGLLNREALDVAESPVPPDRKHVSVQDRLIAVLG